MARREAEKMQKIREDIKKWDDYWKVNNQNYHEMTDFVMGDQWRDDESRLFERYNKIPLTMNKLAPLANHMLGEQLQNTPNLQVVPDEGVDEKTAEIYEALLKNITFDSNAKINYQTVFEQMIIGGFSGYRIDTEYDNDYGFDQNIVTRKVNDPTRCFWDLSALTPCKTDGMYAGFRTRMSRKMFKAKYGKKLEASIGSTSGYDDFVPTFFDDNAITIIDYYERKYDKVKIYQLSNDQIIEAKEFKQLEKITIDGDELLIYNGQPVTVVKDRETYRYNIKHTQGAGDFILEETDFPSEQLPIIFADQKSYYDRSGKQICRSFFKDAKDAQRYINYLATQSAYLLKISRYDQFMVSKANVKSPDTQQIWRDPSIVQGGLVYDESPNGNKPEQLRPPELSQSLLQQYERAMMDIQTSTGMYNSQLGEQGNEVSGAAVDARTKRGSYNTYVPFDSLNRAVACGGTVISEAIPKVYDSQRTMMLSMKDQNMQSVTLNKPMDEYGSKIENDMTQGTYKIRLLPGPSYEGQKTEALESLQSLLQSDSTGQVFPMIADLIVENLPIKNNIELRNRLRTLVPPEILEAGKTGKPLPLKQPQPSPEEIMAQLKEKELQAKIQEAQTNAQLKQKELEIKQQELQRKALESHQDMTMDWEKLEMEKQQAAANLQEQVLRYQAELHKTQTDAQIAHAGNIVKLLTHAGEIHHEKDMAKYNKPKKE